MKWTALSRAHAAFDKEAAAMPVIPPAAKSAAASLSGGGGAPPAGGASAPAPGAPSSPSTPSLNAEGGGTPIAPQQTPGQSGTAKNPAVQAAEERQKAALDQEKQDKMEREALNKQEAAQLKFEKEQAKAKIIAARAQASAANIKHEVELASTDAEYAKRENALRKQHAQQATASSQMLAQNTAGGSTPQVAPLAAPGMGGGGMELTASFRRLEKVAGVDAFMSKPVSGVIEDVAKAVVGSKPVAAIAGEIGGGLTHVAGHQIVASAVPALGTSPAKKEETTSVPGSVTAKVKAAAENPTAANQTTVDKNAPTTKGEPPTTVKGAGPSESGSDGWLMPGLVGGGLLAAGGAAAAMASNSGGNNGTRRRRKAATNKNASLWTRAELYVMEKEANVIINAGKEAWIIAKLLARKGVQAGADVLPKIRKAYTGSDGGVVSQKAREMARLSRQGENLADITASPGSPAFWGNLATKERDALMATFDKLNGTVRGALPGGVTPTTGLNADVAKLGQAMLRKSAGTATAADDAFIATHGAGSDVLKALKAHVADMKQQGSDAKTKIGQNFAKGPPSTFDAKWPILSGIIRGGKGTALTAKDAVVNAPGTIVKNPVTSLAAGGAGYGAAKGIEYAAGSDDPKRDASGDINAGGGVVLNPLKLEPTVATPPKPHNPGSTPAHVMKPGDGKKPLLTTGQMVGGGLGLAGLGLGGYALKKYLDRKKKRINEPVGELPPESGTELTNTEGIDNG